MNELSNFLAPANDFLSSLDDEFDLKIQFSKEDLSGNENLFFLAIEYMKQNSDAYIRANISES